ncbi:TIGR02147 family protein [Bdellovibrio sp. HCB117]|uniref:TIGR02147 family protein n=1 Tax=Bdellovibrio sp. HCB117 TaxID=3394359 RepID=UPI0039B519AC
MNELSKILIREFKMKRQRNLKFSLRAFAKFLKTDASNLSKILRGERIPSASFALELLQRLNINTDERNIVLKSLVETKSHLKEEKKEKSKNLEHKIVASCHWLHLILLELSQIMILTPNQLEKISRILNVSLYEVKVAYEELARWDLLNEDGIDNYSTMCGPITAENLRAIQRQFLKMAVDAMEIYDLTERENTTLTFSIPKTHIPEVKEILKKTRDRINRLSNMKKNQKSCIYNISMALYPVCDSADLS